MRKVWQTKRKGIPGVYVEWHDSMNRRRSKYFSPTHKNLIRPFMARKFSTLNADCRQPGEIVKVLWTDFVKEYLDSKDGGLAPASLESINLTLSQFEKIVKPFSTEQINQASINTFLRTRQNPESYNSTQTDEKEKLKPVSPDTINKDVRNLRALFRFGKEKFYIKSDLNVQKVKTEEKLKRVLSDTEIHNLIAACGDDKQWRMRILLAMVTGFRRSDLTRLELKRFDIERKTVSVINKKTGKATNYKPLPDKFIPELTQFILEEIADGQIKFFKTGFTKKWESIKKRAGLEDIQFHDLRRTWGSLQADEGVSMKTLQNGYNHSTIVTTAQSYIKMKDTKQREGVNTLKVDEWLR